MLALRLTTIAAAAACVLAFADGAQAQSDLLGSIQIWRSDNYAYAMSLPLSRRE